jgi:hypothetical protein
MHDCPGVGVGGDWREGGRSSLTWRSAYITTKAHVKADYCGTCGTERPDGATVCPSCGASFAPVSPPQPVPRRRSGNHPLTILALIVLAIGGIYLLNNTQVGLELKCRYLNDLGACVEAVLTAPIGVPAQVVAETPAPTEDPAVAAQQAAQEQLQRAQAAVDQDAQTLASDLAALGQSSLTSDVSAVPPDLKSQAKDVATTLQDLRVVQAESTNGTDGATVCSDADAVSSDADTVGSDESSVESDGSTIQATIESIKAAIKTVQEDASQLQTDQAAAPGYVPAGLPTAQQIAQSVSSANSMIGNAEKTYAGYLTKAKKAVKTANGYAAAAQRVCDSMP